MKAPSHFLSSIQLNTLNIGRPLANEKKQEETPGNVNVKVVIRVRPMNSKEQDFLSSSNSKSNHRETCVEFNKDDRSYINIFTESDKEQIDKHSFNFDYVFPCDSTQKDVYDIAGKPIIESMYLQ